MVGTSRMWDSLGYRQRAAKLCYLAAWNILALLLPGVYATGMAFMLPIATPPNTIVYATKRLQFTSMVKGGFLLNILASLVILLFTATVGKHFFGGGSWDPIEGQPAP